MHKPQKQTAMKKPLESLVSLSTLAVAVLVGLVYFFQLNAMRESVDLSRKALEIDQRPYLWGSGIQPPIKISPGQRMWANIEILNYGKSPALKVRQVGKIAVGPD